MIRYIPSGDSAFIVKAGDVISGEVHITIRKLLRKLDEAKITGVTDIIPSYNEILVCYDPMVAGYRQILDDLRMCEADLESVKLPLSSTVHIPVFYGGEYGPDLQYVADLNSISPEVVIDIHCSPVYLVYMLGFTPGFCYLGGMDPRIATPRRETPRMKIPAGAVGIAGQQTGIYPIESPGGWQIIGRTPLRLFDPQQESPFLLSAGDCVKFFSVTEDEFSRILSEVSNGDYIVRRTENS
ncbi:MAG: 5-oxoprolinase subunit PxpB [Bacteroidales bacterium]|nr:5-oxoprolinase subunit PxpB [Bacteroidales bacterium]